MQDGYNHMGEYFGNCENIYIGTPESESDITIYNINKQPLSKNEINDVVCSDILVVAFPLYVDGIPSHVLYELYELENAFANKPGNSDTVFYGIVNNGFSESNQNKHAATMLELFCERAGIKFGQVLTLGGGEVIRSMIESGAPFLCGPLAYIKDDWCTFTDNIAGRMPKMTFADLQESSTISTRKSQTLK